MVIRTPSCRARSSNTAGSAIAMTSSARSRCAHKTVRSGPIPAGSPGVSAIVTFAHPNLDECLVADLAEPLLQLFVEASAVENADREIAARLGAHILATV